LKVIDTPLDSIDVDALMVDGVDIDVLMFCLFIEPFLTVIYSIASYSSVSTTLSPLELTYTLYSIREYTAEPEEWGPEGANVGEP